MISVSEILKPKQQGSIYQDFNNGVFPKWSRTFLEFSEFGEFRESDKSLRHEMGSI